MSKENKYGLISLSKEFPNEYTCLEHLFNTLHSEECSCGGTYARIGGRKKYQCSKCRFQISPTANTIFHKSRTPLTTWFKAILMFSNAKSGISAKELERQLEVTYKTAWRMLKLIREALTQDNDKLDGVVESDRAYFGGVVLAGENNKNLSKSVAQKVRVYNAKKRGGNMKAQVVPNFKAKTIGQFLEKNVSKADSVLLTDNAKIYRRIAKGYEHHTVDHSKGEYVRGNIHINNSETFWSHVKRSVKGTHKVVSKKYFQNYLDGFVFHHNNAYSDRERFQVLLDTLLHA